MIVVEMPSAVIGVEDRIVCESAASSMPVAVMDVASVGYLYAVGMLA
jgi:ABC-type hemin transport system substrate-binding protein